MSDIDRMFSVLAAYGVPRERARTVENGIEVLMARTRKESTALEQRILALEAALQAVKESAITLIAGVHACNDSRELLRAGSALMNTIDAARALLHDSQEEKG